MADEVETLTPEQSAARIAQLEADGWIVERLVASDGTVVVTKRRPASTASVVSLVLVMLVISGCYLASDYQRLHRRGLA
jgi:hypothetical protein